MKLKLLFIGAIVTALLCPTALPAGATTYTVTIRLERREVDLGKGLHVTGTVTPRRPGDTVSLQERTSKGWKTIKTGRLRKKSTYDIAFKPRAAGDHRYRVVWSYVGSRNASLAVYKWHYLSDLDTVGSGCFTCDTGSASINGTYFPHTISIPAYSSGNYLEWNLRRRCSSFAGTLGLTDDSPTGSIANLSISVDGVELFQSNFGLGSSSAQSLDVNSGLRVRLAAINVVEGDYWATAGFGNARIRCRW